MNKVLSHWWWLFLWAAIILSNTHIDPDHYFTRISALDTSIYLDIAKAAPQLPAPGAELIFHGAQRLLYPYFIGIAARSFGIDPWSIFQWAVVVISFLVSLLFWRLALKACARNYTSAVFLTSIFICHPYLFRLQLTFSGFLNDAIFNLGLMFFIQSYFVESRYLRFIGVLIMAPAKQTILIMAPVMMAAEFLIGAKQRRDTLLFWVPMIGGLVFYYLKINQIIAPFSTPNTTSHMATGFIEWMLHFKGWRSCVELFIFTGRGVLGLLPAVALFAGIISIKGLRFEYSKRNIYMLLLFLCLVAQPIISGPSITDASIQRLVSIGLAPLLFFLGSQLQVFKFPNRKFLICGVGLCFFGATHHLFSRIGPNLGLRYVFLGIHCVSVLGIFALTRVGLTADR